jgi:hypothetical protein
MKTRGIYSIGASMLAMALGMMSFNSWGKGGERPAPRTAAPVRFKKSGGNRMNHRTRPRGMKWIDGQWRYFRP